MASRATIRAFRCARVRFQSTLTVLLGFRYCFAACRTLLASATDCSRTVTELSPCESTPSRVQAATRGAGRRCSSSVQNCANCASSMTFDAT